MATNRLRATVSFDPDEYQELTEWAESEFRTVPQLVLVLVKKALLERREQNPPPSEPKTPSAKAKRESS